MTAEPDYRIIIPARYRSGRLPGKPLADIGGKPMIRHVVEQCLGSRARAVVVATDDERVRDAVEDFGGVAVMTRDDHPSGSDRIAEAVTLLELDDHDIVLNVQGDEPDMPVALMDQVVAALAADPKSCMATASAPLDDADQLTNPAVVKVVTDRDGRALYFSRAPIPWTRRSDDSALADDAWRHARRHLGIYAYRAGYIREFAARPACPPEKMEQLEQLRALWHGETITCVEAVEVPGPGIDTPADLDKARASVGGA